MLLVLLCVLPPVLGTQLLITLDWPNATAGQQPAPRTAQAAQWSGSRLRVRAEGLWTLCRGDRLHVQLGLCSSHFIECARIGGGFIVRTCPFKSFVFMNGQCLPAQQFRECHDSVANVINEETKHLVEAESFCASGAGIYRGYNGPSMDACSRQALICHPNRRDAISIFCASGQSLTEGLNCVSAPRSCHYGLEVTAPIRQFFLQRACNAALLGRKPTSTPSNKYQAETQCASWYVMCYPRPVVIQCGPGEIFDRYQQKCRRWRSDDVCAMSGVCRGREWQSVPLEQCQNQFIYCEGSVGKLYACGDGMVFNGECVPRESLKECGTCREGERRPGGSCNEFYECVRSFNGFGWESRNCGGGAAFNDYLKTCQKDYTCAAAKTCIHGSSIPVNCRDYLYCTGERYEMFSCPPNTRWDAHSKFCIRDAACGMSTNPSPMRCLSGDAVPSVDCVSYQMCTNGSYLTAPCRDNFGYPAIACSHCFSSSDSYPVDRLTYPGQCSAQDRLPHPQDCAAYYECVGKSWSYRRCEGAGTFYVSSTKTCRQRSSWQCSSPAQVQCRHGERILNRDPAMCDRLIECRRGQWVDLQCPAGYVYDAKTFNCVRGECVQVQGYPEVLPPPRRTEWDAQGLAPPTAAPPPSQGSPGLSPSNRFQTLPGYVAQSCSGKMRVADQYDCSRFWECGPSNRFYNMACAAGSVFDPRRNACVQGTCSFKVCVENSFQPTEQCGHYRTCYRGQWLYARCDLGKRFVNGQCTKDDCVAQNFGEEYYSLLQCRSGAVRPHPTDQFSYMFCQYGVWTERSCPQGAVFDWKVLGCVVNPGSPPQYRPQCYDGDTKPLDGECSLYEECVRGQWTRKACPYGQRFHNGYCMVGHCSGQAGRCRESAGVDGYRRAQHDCSKYYQCVHGKWLERPCAPGTVFNERISVCDHARNVPECGGSV